MMINSMVAWNMSVTERRRNRGNRLAMKRFEFFQYINQSLLRYNDPRVSNAPSPERVRRNECSVYVGDTVHVTKWAEKGTRCIVYRLEQNWRPKELGQKFVTMSAGTCKSCGVDGHTSTLRSSNRAIHLYLQFKNLNCFQILHIPKGMELFQRTSSSSSKGCYTINTKHPICIELQQHHDLPVVLEGVKKAQESTSERNEIEQRSQQVTQTDSQSS
jgi:hypothetical protein